MKFQTGFSFHLVYVRRLSRNPIIDAFATLSRAGVLYFGIVLLAHCYSSISIYSVLVQRAAQEELDL